MTLSVIGSCYAFPHSLLFPLYAGMLRRLTLLGCCVSPLSLPLLSSCSIRFASLAVAVIVSSTAVEKVHVHRCVCILTADSLSFVFLFISPSCILPGMGQYIYIYMHIYMYIFSLCECATHTPAHPPLSFTSRTSLPHFRDCCQVALL